MSVRIIEVPIQKAELDALAESQFGNLVKAVVDVEQGVMAIGGELHADEEAVLLERGSKQEYLWGINLYPKKEDDGWVEFDSLINIRPSRGNSSRDVEDQAIREKIRGVVKKLIF